MAAAAELLSTDSLLRKGEGMCIVQKDGERPDSPSAELSHSSQAHFLLFCSSEDHLLVLASGQTGARNESLFAVQCPKVRRERKHATKMCKNYTNGRRTLSFLLSFFSHSVCLKYSHQNGTGSQKNVSPVKAPVLRVNTGNPPEPPPTSPAGCQSHMS